MTVTWIVGSVVVFAIGLFCGTLFHAWFTNKAVSRRRGRLERLVNPAVDERKRAAK